MTAAMAATRGAALTGCIGLVWFACRYRASRGVSVLHVAAFVVAYCRVYSIVGSKAGWDRGLLSIHHLVGEGGELLTNTECSANRQQRQIEILCCGTLKIRR